MIKRWLLRISYKAKVLLGQKQQQQQQATVALTKIKYECIRLDIIIIERREARGAREAREGGRRYDDPRAK